MEFIQSQALSYPELAERYGGLGELFSKKLWHQLTIALTEFVNDDSNRRGTNFIDLYEQFVSKFEGKLNQLEFAKFIGAVAKTYSEPAATFQFFGRIMEKRNRLGVDATLYLEILLLMAKLNAARQNLLPPEESTQTMIDIKDQIGAKRSEVDALQGLMDTCVHSAYYQLATEFYKGEGPPELFYKNALMLLAYTPMPSLKNDQALALATDMSLAALSGDGVYNFGEVLATPIVGVLEGTPNQWLGDMLKCFNRGDIDQFTVLLESHKTEYYAQPALKLRHEFIKQKLALLAFMNLVLETPAHERNLAFAAIGQRTRMPTDQVEWLVMKAMSLGLVKGEIDEVEEVVHVSWVQPRVLDELQMQQLASRLGDWAGKVDEMTKFIGDQTMELFE